MPRRILYTVALVMVAAATIGYTALAVLTDSPPDWDEPVW